MLRAHTPAITLYGIPYTPVFLFPRSSRSSFSPRGIRESSRFWLGKIEGFEREAFVFATNALEILPLGAI